VKAQPVQVLEADLGDSAEKEGKTFDRPTSTSLEESVWDDVKIIKDSPFIADDIPIHGFIYDVSHGGLICSVAVK